MQQGKIEILTTKVSLILGMITGGLTLAEIDLILALVLNKL